jgi:tetratricopeptide (TPR) repeat protein
MKIKHLIISFLVLALLSSCSILSKKEKLADKDPRIADFNFNFYFLEANKQKILGNNEDALRNYLLALKIDQTQAAVHYEIAGILNMLHDFSGALEYAKKSVELDKTSNQYYRLLLAFIYQNNGLHNEAIKVYEDLLKINPDNIHFYFEISSIYQTLEKNNDAIKIMDRAQKRFGIIDIISLEKEKIYLAAGNKKAALIEIEKLCETYPQNMRYKAVLAESYAKSGKLNQAKELYSILEKGEFEDGIIYFSIADFYRVIKEYEKSFELLNKGFARDDVELDIKVRMMVSMMDYMSGDEFLTEKIGRLVEILRLLYPENVKVRALNADYLLITKKYKEAQGEFDFILSKDKDKYDIWDQALYLDFILLDMESMYKRSKEAVSYYPNILDLYQYYIVSAYATENYIDVIEAVDYASILAARNQPLLLEFLSMQGDSYYKTNNYEKSDSVYEVILYKDREYVLVLNNYSYFLAERGEKLDRALELSTRLISIEPKNATYLDTHAWVLFKTEKYSEALSFIIKQSILIKPMPYISTTKEIFYLRKEIFPVQL